MTDGLLASLADFEDLVRPLDEEQWSTPSRCEGWTVGDVARHVIGGMADVAAGRFDALGTPEVTKREVDERAGRSPAELADECAEVAKAAAGLLPMFDDEGWAGPAPGGFEGTLGDGVEALWYDNWLHAEDIRAAIGHPVDVGSHLPGAVSHVGFELRKRGWDGEVPSTPDEQVAWVMAATGRAPLPDGLIDIYADA
ncbi:MAG: maleylpyruvate isomerase family mycothiol-dependent enzyme [Acidimicrobiia bacterium]|nr:maleylpyruvate isomerase family mycothiol-dependent enzyme [Acidimicrobiia bacterium]